MRSGLVTNILINRNQGAEAAYRSSPAEIASTGAEATCKKMNCLICKRRSRLWQNKLIQLKA
jgi:hypothetical protein